MNNAGVQEEQHFLFEEVREEGLRKSFAGQKQGCRRGSPGTEEQEGDKGRGLQSDWRNTTGPHAWEVTGLPADGMK